MNSGGVVFFAFFNGQGSVDAFPREEAAVIKVASPRMATQSERLGYELAKWLGIQTENTRNHPKPELYQNRKCFWNLQCFYCSNKTKAIGKR